MVILSIVIIFLASSSVHWLDCKNHNFLHGCSYQQNFLCHLCFWFYLPISWKSPSAFFSAYLQSTGWSVCLCPNKPSTCSPCRFLSSKYSPTIQYFPFSKLSGPFFLCWVLYLGVLLETCIWVLAGSMYLGATGNGRPLSAGKTSWYKLQELKPQNRLGSKTLPLQPDCLCILCFRK